MLYDRADTFTDLVSALNGSEERKQARKRKYSGLAVSTAEQSHMQSNEGAGDRWQGNQRRFEL